MTQYDAPVDMDAEASAVFNDAIISAIREAGITLEASGRALTLNALMGSLCAVAAFHIAGIEDARVRKVLMREMEKQLPRLVAHQRVKESPNGRGKVVTLVAGRPIN